MVQVWKLCCQGKLNKVRRALAKQVMTKRWWTSSLLGCACKTMSRASAR